MNSKSVFSSLLQATIALISLNVFASTETEKKWEEFQANTKRVMREIPQKRNQDGEVLPSMYDSLFNRRQISSGAYLRTKADQRKEQLRTMMKQNRFFSGTHHPIDELLDKNEFTAKGVEIAYSLDEMEKRGLLEAKLDTQPWSGSYWPTYQGGLGARYASANFMGTGNEWKSYYDYIASSDKLSDVYASADAKRIDDLSPAEKYDLLVSKPNPQSVTGMTYHVWNEGEYFSNAFGKVETWMGICHGWAPAAFSVARPVRSIDAKASDGTTALKFYPTDIKGLATYLWAQARVPASFVGSRCNDKNPKRDPETDRLIDEDCFDTNPAVWHISMINQIGVAKRSFVMDATYDYEVWNQPVLSYSYSYFNPQTGKPQKTWSDARVERAAFTKDKFKKFRSPEAKSYVGVEMKATYISEAYAEHSDTDSEDNDQTRTVTYMYDLELDVDGKIIGGEWYNANHPDFLWLPNYLAKPTLPQDSELTGAWTPEQPLPEFWKRIASVTAERTGLPLPTIVDAIVDAAKDPAVNP
jgi:hypothetical protein